MATCPTCRSQYPDNVKTCPTHGEALLPDAVVAAMAADLLPGQTVGEYRIEGKLGEGGFGAVYRAVHPLIGKAAAIKVLHKQYSSNPQMVSRFIAEARAVNQVQSRNIIDIFSFGALPDGRQYYVMELLSGVTLDGYLQQKGRLSPEEAVVLLRGVARALDAAHAAGVAHRDIKPENVFLVHHDDEGMFPKLLDFGIAKLLGDSVIGPKTRTGTAMGTPHYMSPEQCHGRHVDHRTDIYSFGVLLFQALTGRVPFDGEGVMDILLQHTSAAPPKPSAVCPDLRPAIDAPVLQLLEKDPAARPPTVGAGLDAVAQAAASAGYDVKLSSRRSGETPMTTGDRVRVGRTSSASTGAIGEAQTIVQYDAAKTIPSVESARRLRGPAMYLFGTAVVLGLAAVAVTWLRVRPAPVEPGPVATVTMSAAASSIVVAPQVEASAAPSVTPSATLPAEVEITLDLSPKVVAEVLLGASKIGTSDKPVRLPRGDGKVKLTVKAPGFRPSTLEVGVLASGTVAVTLIKAGPPGGKKGKPEVEY